MPSCRYQIFIWENEAGLFSAVPVEDLDEFGDAWEELAGVADTERGARQQLMEFLTWLSKENQSLPEPGLKDAQCMEFAVPLRPEYQEDSRVFSCEYQIRIPFICVQGNLGDELRFASVPYLGFRFRYFEGEPFKNLFIHQMQHVLKGKTVKELARFFPPRSHRLDTITVKIPVFKPRHFLFKPDLSTLSAVAEPFDQRAGRRRFVPAWEREQEVSDLLTRITEEKINIILVGESGSGKTTLLAESIRRLSNQEKPENPRFWQTSAQRLIAGMKYLGQWEERCEAVIRELEWIDGILCVENLLDLIRVGGTGPTESVASFFLPYLRSNELRLIAEAAPSEMDACRRLLPGFAEHFQILSLPSLERIQVLTIFERMAEQVKKNEGIRINKDVYELIYRLFSRFYPYSPFPGRAARFMSQLLDRVLQEKIAEVSKDQVIDLFVQQTGLPELFLRDELPFSPEEIFKELTTDVIGQDRACCIAADVIAAFKAGLNDPHRPIGVLMFCGPTGVGKTQLAKSIAQFCFGHGEEKHRLIRLDMSEYAMPGSADRLTGSESELIKKIRQQPFVVLLLDEIEKAAPEVFDMLLGLFDEGRFTDTYGRVSSFRSAIIIMTSNLGVKTSEPIGFDADDSGDYEREITIFFRPEFYNRLDEVITFTHLSQDHIHAITEKELREIAAREGFVKRDLTISWSDAVVRYIAHIGYDKRYGARNLQRTIEEKITTLLARYILENSSLSKTQLMLDVDDWGNIRIMLN